MTRTDLLERYRALPLPTTKDESWRFTDLKDFDPESFSADGAEDAINLDGGGSATLVHRKHLLNRPYSNQDQPAPESRPVVTAFVFESRDPRQS